MYYYGQLFSFGTMEVFKNDDAVVEGGAGGLVIGPSHEEGGIYFLYEFPEGYRVYGEVQGFEYIVNPQSSEKHEARLKVINNRSRDIIFDFNKDEKPNATIIDAISPDSSTYNAKFIILDINGGFSVINRNSTKRFLTEIEAINNCTRQDK